MFTLKHVNDLGYESIYAGTEVQFSNTVASNTSDGCVWYTAPTTGEVKSLESGTVYVMNDIGKTVATYRMTPVPAAQGTQDPNNYTRDVHSVRKFDSGNFSV